jgi:hypothetical protein
MDLIRWIILNIYGYDYLSVAANSYKIRNLDYEFWKKSCQFSKFCKCGRPDFESVDWVSIPKYSGYAVGWFRNSHWSHRNKIFMVSEKQKDIPGLVLGFVLIMYFNINPIFVIMKTKWLGLLDIFNSSSREILNRFLFFLFKKFFTL